jgi:CRISPR-associated protein Cas2
MMAVLWLEAAPDHLDGYVTRIMQRIGPNLFVGTVSRRVADELWDTVIKNLPTASGTATLITPDRSTELGWQMKQHQTDPRGTRNFDGIWLPVLRK